MSSTKKIFQGAPSAGSRACIAAAVWSLSRLTFISDAVESHRFLLGRFIARGEPWPDRLGEALELDGVAEAGIRSSFALESSMAR
jgi:hypothetical protein